MEENTNYPITDKAIMQQKIDALEAEKKAWIIEKSEMQVKITNQDSLIRFYEDPEKGLFN
jgi:hypothetical protein